MPPILASSLLISFIFLALYITHRHRLTKKVARQLHGLTVLETGLSLMTKLQQHRGMSIAFINGDQKFKPQLDKKQSEIQGTLADISALIIATPELTTDQKTLNNILTHWQNMFKNLSSMTAEQSFHQHTQLIRIVIHLIGDVGEHLGLFDGEGTQLAKLSNTLLLQLPLLLESIGQARGLGAGYAAKGQSDAVGRIRLSFLEQRIRECQENLHFSSNASTVATDKVAKLLKTLEDHFIEKNTIDISPTLFFSTASDAIDACLTLWKEVAIHTGNAVQSRH